MSAKVVFATAIGYLKDHLVGEIKHRKLNLVDSEANLFLLILKQLGYTEAGGITLRDYYVQTEVVDWLQKCAI
jgi:hypothetical protein